MLIPVNLYWKVGEPTYWILLISAKILTKNLSSNEVNKNKQSIDWNLMYYPKDIKSKIKCNELRKRFNNMCKSFIHYSSL